MSFASWRRPTLKRHINYSLLIIVALLAFFGMAFLATLSAPESLKTFGNTNYYLFHQLFAFGIGLALALLFLKVPLRLLKKAAPWLFLLNILVLIVVALVGTKLWGAKRWVSIGNNSFQPSEFLKITSVLYVSAWLSEKFLGNSKGKWILSVKKGYEHFIWVFLPFLLLLALISAMLYAQKDVSSLGIMGATLLIVYFAADSPIWHVMLAFVASLVSLSIFIIKEPYRIQRLETLFHPESDPLGVGLQLKQSLIALGSGGFLGKGWGMSTQKFGALPQAMSDSVFAILGEETGIIGCTVVILLFVLFLYTGFKIAASSTDKFSKLTAVGICSWITLQAFVNIASTSGIFPLSGIPLPFFSYGGSHLMAEIAAVGILLNISKNG